MKAVAISEFGPPENLRLVELPTPAPGPGEILVRVEAAGVNRPDILQRLGQYPPPPGVSDLPGLEVAGTIASVGPDVDGGSEGDSVCALVAGGGYAEYCVVPEPQALPLPRGMRPGEAAAIPETFFTVWTNLFRAWRAHARARRVLIHGGSSGIGTTAIQLARAFGATAFATAGCDAKCAACERLGARGDQLQALGLRSGRQRSDERAGRRRHPRHRRRRLPAAQHRVPCDARPPHSDRTPRQRPRRSEPATDHEQETHDHRIDAADATVEEKGAIARELEARVWPLLASRQIRPIIHQTLSFSEARKRTACSSLAQPSARSFSCHEAGRRGDVDRQPSSARHICALQIDEPGRRDTGCERRQRKSVARNGLMREHRPVERLPGRDGGEHERHAVSNAAAASCPITLSLPPPPRPQPRRGTATPPPQRCRGARATTASMAARRRNRADARAGALRTRAATSRGTSPECMACAPRRGCKARSS